MNSVQNVDDGKTPGHFSMLRRMVDAYLRALANHKPCELVR